MIKIQNMSSKKIMCKHVLRINALELILEKLINSFFKVKHIYSFNKW